MRDIKMTSALDPLGLHTTRYEVDDDEIVREYGQPLDELRDIGWDGIDGIEGAILGTLY